MNILKHAIIILSMPVQLNLYSVVLSGASQLLGRTIFIYKQRKYHTICTNATNICNKNAANKRRLPNITPTDNKTPFKSLSSLGQTKPIENAILIIFNKIGRASC